MYFVRMICVLVVCNDIEIDGELDWVVCVVCYGVCVVYVVLVMCIV